jgi:hypothetical protein
MTVVPVSVCGWIVFGGADEEFAAPTLANAVEVREQRPMRIESRAHSFRCSYDRRATGDKAPRDRCQSGVGYLLDHGHTVDGDPGVLWLAIANPDRRATVSPRQDAAALRGVDGIPLIQGLRAWAPIASLDWTVRRCELVVYDGFVFPYVREYVQEGLRPLADDQLKWVRAEKALEVDDAAAYALDRFDALRLQIQAAGGLVTPEQIAADWGVSSQAVAKHVRSLAFPAPVARAGRARLYFKSEVDRWRR